MSFGLLGRIRVSSGVLADGGTAGLGVEAIAELTRATAEPYRERLWELLIC
ncbi:hypothetical protein ACIBI9_06295 [Nonomuraea sp. NPDC050451]|uniref:hypothetical protein n=1 Tax=Nonomuraea sp. NPDC050451 TaxID=3364364 RepID=UPI0037953278